MVLRPVAGGDAIPTSNRPAGGGNFVDSDVLEAETGNSKNGAAHR